MERSAAGPFETSSPARIVELATLVRRARTHASDCVRRGSTDRAIKRAAITDRDRFARVDRRLMPDRLRVPPELLDLLLLEPMR